MPSPKKPADRRQNAITKDLQTLQPDAAKMVAVEPERPDDLPIPAAPKNMLPGSRRIWKAFWTSPVAKFVDTRSDLSRVERWIHWIDQFERTKQIIADEGFEAQGSTGQRSLSPAARYLQVCESALQRAEQDLGLTPKARTQLGVTVALLTKSVDEILANLNEAEDEPLEDVIDATVREVGL